MTGTASHLGLLAGLGAEARCLTDFLPPQLKVTTGLSGARPAGAREAVARLREAGVTHLMSAGFAGGLDPLLRPGRLLMPRLVMSSGGAPPEAVDSAWFERLMALFEGLRPVTAPLFGADLVIADPAAKTLLHERSGAASVDMESHVLAAAATAARLPFVVLRVVCDPAEAILPSVATQAVGPDGETDLPALLRALAAQPGQLPALIRLGFMAGAARKTLLRCGRRSGPVRLGVG